MRNGTYALTVSKAGFATGKLGIAVPISKELRIVLQVDHTPIVDGLVVGGVPTTTSELPSTISAEAMCGMQTYYDSLTLAFQNSVNAGGETLLMLQVLPSFQREYAVTVKRTSSGINLYRTAFQKQLWHELGPPLHVSRTRQQCLDIAKNAQIDTVLIPAPTEQANRLWEVFSKITFESHLREKNLLAQDGTQYIIARPDGASVRLQEAAGGRGSKSEEYPTSQLGAFHASSCSAGGECIAFPIPGVPHILIDHLSKREIALGLRRCQHRTQPRPLASGPLRFNFPLRAQHQWHKGPPSRKRRGKGGATPFRDASNARLTKAQRSVFTSGV